MKKKQNIKYFPTIAIAIALSATGCGKIPDCADQASVELVQSKIWEIFEKNTKNFVEENPHLKHFHNPENAKKQFSIQVEKIIQDQNKNQQGDYSCKASIKIIPPTSNLYNSLKTNRTNDILIKIASAHYDMPEIKNRKGISLSGLIGEEETNKARIKQDKDALEFITSYANFSEEDKPKIESMSPQLVQVVTMMPLAGIVSPNYHETIKKAAASVKVDNPDKPAKISDISFSSGVRKIDGNNRHHIELDAGDSINFAVNAYLATLVYNLGDAKIQNLKKYEDDFRKMIIGKWAGKYSCEGLDEASTSAQGPFSMNVISEVKQVSKSFDKYSIELSRTTLTGGLEKLTGEFSSKDYGNWKLTGTGRNSIDDTWQAAYDMKLVNKVIEGAGRTFTDSGETLRQCKISLVRN